MGRPLLLDLYCGAGGAAVGYHRAGFDVIGVDNRPQKRYPFRFVQGDALKPPFDLRMFDAIHASPPCQAYSLARPKTYWGHGIGALAGKPLKPAIDLLVPTLEFVIRSGKPFVIENVVGAPIGRSARLCGLMFGLKVFRHRQFASSFLIIEPEHPKHAGKRVGIDGFCCVAGDGDSGRGRKRTPRDHRTKEAWERAMGIDWMTKDELVNSIPPAYTEWIGRQLLNAIGG